MAKPIDILHLIPDLTAISQEKLQGFCDEWLQRPIAKQFGIAQIFVDEQLMLEVNLDAERAEIVDDNVFIPIDELIGYIIDQHFDNSEERRKLHASVRNTRQRWSELNRGYEATVGRAGTLYLVCKPCQAMLETAHTGIEGQVVECPPCDVTCPACGQTYVYNGSDLKLRLDRA